VTVKTLAFTAGVPEPVRRCNDRFRADFPHGLSSAN
jgi:hypothetical protein